MFTLWLCKELVGLKCEWLEDKVRSEIRPELPGDKLLAAYQWGD